MGILQGDHHSSPAMFWQQQQQQQETPEELLDTKPDNSLSSIQNNNNNDELMQSYHQLDVKEEPEEDHSHKKANSSTTSTTTCAGCGLAITDRYYLVAVDKVWHSECLRCDECSRPLDTALSCFVRQSRIYCREDYQRLFGGRKQCAKCGDELQAEELVMRGRDHLFHTRCFTCHVCHAHLIKGSTFGMVGPLIFCQHHYQPASESMMDTSSPPPSFQPAMSHQPSYGHHYAGDFQFHHHHQAAMYGHHPDMMVPQQQHQPGGLIIDPSAGKLFPAVSPLKGGQQQSRIRTKRRANAKPDAMMDQEEDSYLGGDGMMLDTSSSSSMLGVVSNGQQTQQQQKTKRLRTSFKHQQLRMLKSYFATNHNPDAKDLKQLSQKTSLSKRVLQVWFQNARAKWRRLVQKSEGGGSAAGATNPAGPPSSKNNNVSTSSNSSQHSGSSSDGNDSPNPHHPGSMIHHHLHGYGGNGLMMDHHHHHHQYQQQALMSRSRMSLYDDLSLSGSSVASVGFPSPL